MERFDALRIFFPIEVIEFSFSVTVESNENKILRQLMRAFHCFICDSAGSFFFCL